MDEGARTDPVASAEGAASLRWPEGGDEFVIELTRAGREVAEEFGIAPAGGVDAFFVAFLRKMSRFGVFAFGPISIYVPAVEEALRRDPPDVSEGAVERLVRFSELLNEEQRRSGRRRIDELQVLLAFMRLGEGLPGKVFGELAVSPEQVERYAQRAGVPEHAEVDAARGRELERLFSPEEAAEYLRVHVQTVRAWIRSGRLKASRLAGQRALRIKASDLETVLEPVEPEDL